MKAAILYGAHDFRIEEIETPSINDDQCLVDVKACGVCHSEIHQWEKTLDGLEYPRFIGHEIAGIIKATGKNISEFNVGDRVAVWTDGTGYAEQAAVDSRFIFKLNDEISFAEALAEPIGCTTNGVLKAGLELDQTVALVGTGFMGLIMIQELKLMGLKKIIAIDVRKEMLDLAEKLSADVVLNPLKEDANAAIKNLTNGKGVDAAFEVGGNEKTLNMAANITRMEGKLVIFGFHPGARKIDDLGYWNWMAFDIVNAHFRNVDTIYKGTKIGMNLLNDRKINMKPLVTHSFELKEIEKAFEAANTKPEGFVKAVIVNE
ncbi:MAG: zinc-binding dehydrogenase [Melioribacteraceae bacterium]|nr:zinc-binding dehydrogenase [Melioribacteraceae bacterium]MCF8355465.1 zinc-binding dehydrogenase [Melioribacteraceae bacterium]MCF8392558.1 zinc-binding dehydrogenase [Melioribacteraceae bacterium]MCF8418427.1 zinc-binding dehydrogenase [Melioribacteraceae bacterium]